MRIIEPDFSKMKEPEIGVEHYYGSEEELNTLKDFVVYEEDANGVLYPSFIRCYEQKPNIGAKATIEAINNGFIISSGRESYVSLSAYDMEARVRLLTHKYVEVETKLDEDEIEELREWTLKINEHFEEQKILAQATP
ncbi:MAG: hypothetical protein ACTSQB_00320 [Candidatus Heimdallarchaeota archaeon]